MFYPNERIAIAIDGKNTFEACRALGHTMDFKALRDTFSAKSRLIELSLYTMTRTDETGYNSLQGTLDWADYNGYVVHTKPIREYETADGRTVYRGSVDVDLTVRTLSIAQHIDHLVLFSGNGDFAPLCMALQLQGVRVTVVSSIKAKPAIASDVLRRAATGFIDLADIAKEIMKERESDA